MIIFKTEEWFTGSREGAKLRPAEDFFEVQKNWLHEKDLKKQ